MKRFKTTQRTLLTALLTGGAVIVAGTLAADSVKVTGKVTPTDAIPATKEARLSMRDNLNRPDAFRSVELIESAAFDLDGLNRSLRGAGGTTVNQSTSPIVSPTNLNGGVCPSFIDEYNNYPLFLYDFSSSSNQGGNSVSEGHNTSTDGRYVVINTRATNYTSPTLAADATIARYDRNTGDFVSTTRNTDGTQHDQPYVLYIPGHAMSGDGRYTVWGTAGADANDGVNTNPYAGVFHGFVYRYDIDTGTMDVVNPLWGESGFNGTYPGTQPGNGIWFVDISNDGRYVFYSQDDPVIDANGPQSHSGVFAQTSASTDNTLIYMSDMGVTPPAQYIISCDAAGALPLNETAIIRAPAVTGDTSRVVFMGSSPTLSGAQPVPDIGSVGLYMKTIGNPATPTLTGATPRVDVDAGLTTYGDSTFFQHTVTKAPSGTQYAVFMSDDNNLANLFGYTLTAGEHDLLLIYRKNLDTGALELVSKVATDGDWPTITDCFFPSVSDDGNYISWCYAANATGGNDVAALGDTNSSYDVAVRDMTGGVTRLWTVGPTGRQTTGGLRAATISRDGNSVAIATRDAGFDVFATGSVSNLYFFDGVIPSTNPMATSLDRVVASNDPTGLFNGNSFTPAFNGRGDIMALTSYANNVPVDFDDDGTFEADANGGADVFLKYLDGNSPWAFTDFELVSISYDGTAFANGSSGGASTPDFSTASSGPFEPALFNGQYGMRRDDYLTGALDVEFDPNSFGGEDGSGAFKLCFSSTASNLIDPLGAVVDGNATFDVFVRNYDGVATSTSAVSVNAAGDATGSSASFNGRISKDGNFAAFTSFAIDLTATAPANDGTAADHVQVYRRNLGAGTNKAISVDSAGNYGSDPCGLPDLSDNGRFVVFSHTERDAYGANPEALIQVIRADVFSDGAPPSFTPVSRFTAAGAPSPGSLGDWHSNSGRLSPDGSKVVFTSGVDFLGLNGGSFGTDPNFTPAQWAPHTNGAIVADTFGNGPSTRSMVYVWDSATDSHDIVSFNTTTSLLPQIIIHAVGTGIQTTELANAQSSHGVFTADGLYVAFWSRGENLLNADDEPFNSIIRGDETNGGFVSTHNVMLWDSATGDIDILSYNDSGTEPLAPQFDLPNGNRPTRIAINNVASISGMAGIDSSADEDIADVNGVTDVVTFGTPAEETPTPTPVTGVSGSWDLYPTE